MRYLVRCVDTAWWGNGRHRWCRSTVSRRQHQIKHSSLASSKCCVAFIYSLDMFHSLLCITVYCCNDVQLIEHGNKTEESSLRLLRIVLLAVSLTIVGICLAMLLISDGVISKGVSTLNTVKAEGRRVAAHQVLPRLLTSTNVSSRCVMHYDFIADHGTACPSASVCKPRWCCTTIIWRDQRIACGWHWVDGNDHHWADGHTSTKCFGFGASLISFSFLHCFHSFQLSVFSILYNSTHQWWDPWWTNHCYCIISSNDFLRYRYQCMRYQW